MWWPLYSAPLERRFQIPASSRPLVAHGQYAYRVITSVFYLIGEAAWHWLEEEHLWWGEEARRQEIQAGYHKISF